MLNIAGNNIITMTRGDTVSFEITVNSGSTTNPIYTALESGDNVYFGLSEYNKTFEHAILKKVLTKENEVEPGVIRIVLESDETVNLVPGVYFYEVKLEKVVRFEILENKTEVSTIVPRTKFIIL